MAERHRHRRISPGPRRRGARDRQGSRGRRRLRVRRRARRRARPRACLAGPGARARLVAEARGAADALALRLRHHDAGASCPRRAGGRRRARGVRRARDRAGRGARRAGDGRSPRQSCELTEARVRGDAIVRARTAEEVPLATAVGLIARERLTGEAPPKAAAAGLEAGRAVDRGEGGGRARRAGADARRPGGVREAVAAAARGPRPRRRRGADARRSRRTAATTRRARRAAATTRPTRATRARRAAATSRCAARRPRTTADEGSRPRRWKPATRMHAPATTSAKACSPRPAGATGSLSPETDYKAFTTRFDEIVEAERAVRRGGARPAARLSRPADGAACRMSSPGSPTGCSGG